MDLDVLVAAILGQVHVFDYRRLFGNQDFLERAGMISRFTRLIAPV
jgi:hypothetical protein